MSKKSSTALESALAWMEKHAAENLELAALRKLTAEVAKNNEELKELAVKLGLALDRRETTLKKLKVELKAAKAARKSPKATSAPTKKAAPAKKSVPAKKEADPKATVKRPATPKP